MFCYYPESVKKPVKLFPWKSYKKHWFVYFFQSFLRLLFNFPIIEPVKLFLDLESMKGKFHYNLTTKSVNGFFKLTGFALGRTGKFSNIVST